eukprot:CAMPEP_0206535660 /NCGR_PEP_ID=MMETSP0325_2-20121206/6274_1 /ASSEMBLY_ACC=CAM_ASM_000347 /TAXON_ID=2866 /ORGANISM="Crypthecodinium cohnii, Strain Seligo" /LENGTH=1075 /DNA_ID=CAMNT_0054032699 /DNA_START=250 /DNA_END=3475 /DNA_ORIENTATION=+
MSAVLETMGQSTQGWSKVGIHLAESLEEELNAKMINVSLTLVDSLTHVSFVQDALDGILALAGNVTDGGSTDPAALLEHHRPAVVSLLQAASSNSSDNSTNGTEDAIAALTPVIMSAVHSSLAIMKQKVSDVLAAFLEKIKPALETVGEWLLTFGKQIQSGVDTFSLTLDKAQQIFDQVMSQMHGGGSNKEDMLNTTFALFDATGDGVITAEDLKAVATLYSITALQGNLSDSLVATHDSNGDGKLDLKEMGALVDDPAIPNVMAVVLRTYAKRLAEVAGAVAGATARDELSSSIVEYFQLVCAKNKTKVSWVSDRLSNGSLPQAFTGDVLIQLCLKEKEDDKLTMGSVGEIVVKEMYRLHPDYTLEVFDLLANSSFWEDEGFDIESQPGCLKTLSGYLMTSLVEMLDPEPSPRSKNLVQTIPMSAWTSSKRSVSLLMQRRQKLERQHRQQHYHSETAQLLSRRLFGGSSVRATVAAAGVADKVAKRSMPAAPETLEFAMQLAANASATAQLRQEMCFNYSSQSSNVVDGFASQIEGVVSHVQSFLDMMMQYASPSGIEKLEADITEFIESGLDDVSSLIETRLSTALNNSAPLLERSIHQAAHHAGEEMGERLGQLLGTPIGVALAPTLNSLISDFSNGSSAAEGLLGEALGEEVSSALANLTAKALAKQGGDLFEELVDGALTSSSEEVSRVLKEVTAQFAVPTPTSLLQTSSSGLVPPTRISLIGASSMGADAAKRRPHRGLAHLHPAGIGKQELDDCRAEADAAGDDADKVLALFAAKSRTKFAAKERGIQEAVSGVWNNLVKTLQMLVRTIPSAINTLKSARREVLNLQSNLNSTFTVFEKKGPEIFNTISYYYSLIWTIYFLCLLPLNGLVFYYAFWASGYFGGPQPIVEEEIPSRTWREKCSMCCTNISSWVQRHHDTTGCFWAVITILQIIVLIIFIASVVLCIISGLKALILAGCDQVYVLSDETICSETLGSIRDWLQVFLTEKLGTSGPACVEDNLLTCRLIQEHMVTSTVLSTIFSVFATIFALQLIIEFAILHEQARWRRAAKEEPLALPEASAPSAAASSE